MYAGVVQGRYDTMIVVPVMTTRMPCFTAVPWRRTSICIQLVHKYPIIRGDNRIACTRCVGDITDITGLTTGL